MLQRISEPLSHEGKGLGNKGKNLCILRQAGFEVPDGVILDREEYLEFLKINGIEAEVARLLASLNGSNVDAVGEELQGLFAGTRLGGRTFRQLEEELGAQERYAVRSSASKEDLQDFSFAGQYETRLNVSGMDAVEQAVIDCYRSLFTPVSLGYLVHHKLSPQDLTMSVVVQKMVPSELSGVCFTINPLTGNDKEMSIEIAEGLGENLVSGRVVPEQYFYNWYDKKGYSAEQNRLLEEGKLKEFGETFLKIQLLFGYPCDIEFAVAEGKLFILQARGITKINYAALTDIWTTADFKDGGVSASVCTPYMWSLYEYIWEFSLRRFLLDSKILTPKELDKKLGDMFYGRCYWNLSVVKLALSKVIGYREREFDSEYGIRITYEGDGHVTRLTPGTFVAIARMFFAQRKILKERNDNCERYRQDLLEKYEYYKKIYDTGKLSSGEEVKKLWYELTRKTYLQSESTYFWQIFINTVHQSLYKDSLLKYVSESEYLTLLGAIDNISHMLPFYEMWDISRQIRSGQDSLRFWQEHEPGEICACLEGGENALQRTDKQQGAVSDARKEWTEAVRRLIAGYGYHSDKELDVTYPCYYEDPLPLIAGIRDMVSLGDEFSPLEDKARGEANYQKLLGEIRGKVRPGKYRRLEKKIRGMRKMLWWREEYRDLSTRFYYLIRVYTIKLSEHLAETGVLEAAEDIWFIRVSALWDYLDGRLGAEELREMVRKNREYYMAYAHYISENEIGGAGGETQEEAAGQEGAIRGLGANSGRVTGTARVIEDFREISRLQQNDILVTRFTDTGWTPKFAILSGIVTEYGGILCHAAIVSREYGIPAIVNCHDAMSRIRDGQTITIDGATGYITVEEQEKE